MESEAQQLSPQQVLLRKGIRAVGVGTKLFFPLLKVSDFFESQDSSTGGRQEDFLCQNNGLSFHSLLLLLILTDPSLVSKFPWPIRITVCFFLRVVESDIGHQ